MKTYYLYYLVYVFHLTKIGSTLTVYSWVPNKAGLAGTLSETGTGTGTLSEIK